VHDPKRDAENAHLPLYFQGTIPLKPSVPGRIIGALQLKRFKKVKQKQRPSASGGFRQGCMIKGSEIALHPNHSDGIFYHLEMIFSARFQNPKNEGKKPSISGKIQSRSSTSVPQNFK
jgi:hypothetical protein